MKNEISDIAISTKKRQILHINQYPITTWIDDLMKGIFLCNFYFTRPRFQSTPKEDAFKIRKHLFTNDYYIQKKYVVSLLANNSELYIKDLKSGNVPLSDMVMKLSAGRKYIDKNNKVLLFVNNHKKYQLNYKYDDKLDLLQSALSGLVFVDMYNRDPIQSFIINFAKNFQSFLYLLILHSCLVY
ncbi:hypothetical protein H8356DRAFT_1362926 [Neocallimastix lanati (nom. inval.)]|nr:hypothetical protein H8356DRAFT_1362926 [Neocallimastix sp. JGI-2020a]